MDVSKLGKQALYEFVVARRDNGTFNGKVLKKVKAKALVQVLCDF
jgi:hypothetical protein